MMTGLRQSECGVFLTCILAVLLSEHSIGRIVPQHTIETSVTA